MSKSPEKRLPSADTEADALIERIHTLPESEALHCYAQLSPRLQWLARMRTSGARRAALIVHHAISIAHCR